MNVPVDYIILVGSVIGSIIFTFLVTKRKYQPKKCITEPTVDKLLTSVPPINSDKVNPVHGIEQLPLENLWRLDVLGTAKFDIKVEWTDGGVDFYSGTAPISYDIARPIGFIPTNTCGIPPEWADDGISYQWSLNGHHWS